jgi:hypothetical protein
MDTKSLSKLFEENVERFTRSPQFRAIEAGDADYDAFIENVARAHLKSPQLVAFLYALAPPLAAPDLLENLLEELGLDAESERDHPALLQDMVSAAGLADRLPAIRDQAEDDLRRIVVDPLLYGSLRDVGLAALTEIVAFEFMLSRVAGRIARALAAHRGLSDAALAWFNHHSEVDIRHAEQGLRNLVTFLAYYDIAENDALTIIDMTLREDVFSRRYFRGTRPAEPRR